MSTALRYTGSVPPAPPGPPLQGTPSRPLSARKAHCVVHTTDQRCPGVLAGGSHARPVPGVGHLTPALLPTQRDKSGLLEFAILPAGVTGSMAHPVLCLPAFPSPTHFPPHLPVPSPPHLCSTLTSLPPSLLPGNPTQGVWALGGAGEVGTATPAAPCAERFTATGWTPSKPSPRSLPQSPREPRG